MDLLTDLAEKVSASLANKEVTGDVPVSAEGSIQGMTSFPAEASTSIGNGKESEKEKKAKSEGSKGGQPRQGVPS